MTALLDEIELALVPANYTLNTTQIPLPSPKKSFKVRVVRRRGAYANAHRRQEIAVP